ncbi:lipid II flippase MurJ [Streptomyces albus]|uniref:lipid II flippase MurJ n=1 Tax=Streptomyces albus TaxID=1888 RepID=UPI003D133E6A
MAQDAPRLGRFLARAAAVTAVLTAAGSLFGLFRDQAIAHLFGANADTDAFLVAWTVPELSATLLIEDAMALILVPAFSLALSRRAAHRAAAGPASGAGDPVRELVAATLPRLSLALAGTAGLLVLAAPHVVRLLAPGLPHTGTATDCLRLTALTVVTFGLAGYFSAALRAHRHFVAPAAIYLAYNSATIAVMFAGHALWGVRAAALGVAVGGAAMVLVQLPGFLSRLPARPPRTGRTARRAPATGAAQRERAAVRTAQPEGAAVRTSQPGEATVRAAQPEGAAARATQPEKAAVPAAQPKEAAVPTAQPEEAAPAWAPTARTARVRTGPLAGMGLGLGALAPVAAFAVSRQAQVLFERCLASSLPAGAISHLNYAQKVAQLPMVLSLMVCTVTFPLVARAMADGEAEAARRRVEQDLALAGIVVLLGAAYVVACAPQIIGILFERGAFDGRDTAATASVMRVYACGLLGHSMAGALVRPFFSGTRPPWYPAAAMGAGLAVTLAAGLPAASAWGMYGIAAANALGITTTAALLLRGLGARVVAIDVPRVAGGLLRLLLAAVAAAAAGWGAAGLWSAPVTGAAVGAVVVPAVFVCAGRLVGAPRPPHLSALDTRRITHAR